MIIKSSQQEESAPTGGIDNQSVVNGSFESSSASSSSSGSTCTVVRFVMDKKSLMESGIFTTTMMVTVRLHADVSKMEKNESHRVINTDLFTRRRRGVGII